MTNGTSDRGQAIAGRILGLLESRGEARALEVFEAAGGALFAFRNGYPALGRLLDAFPGDLWRRRESVLGALVFYLVKQGRAGRARSYLDAPEIEFRKTALFDLYALMVEIHLGGPVSEERLAGWIALERRLPVSEPLLEGLYHNCMLVMLVRLGRLKAAREAGQRAISCYREADHSYLEHFIHIHLADLGVVEGRLRSARRSLAAAEHCLERSGVLYANERDLIEIIHLAIAYETGRLETIPDRAGALRASLLRGDSWSEVFVQLGRISVMSAFFLSGPARARQELEAFQADYARRHGTSSAALDILAVLIARLDWRRQEAEANLLALSAEPVQSAIGAVMNVEARVALGHAGPDPAALPGPRGAIVMALHEAEAATGAERRRKVERALWLAVDEGQTAPFLEHRDVFAGLGARLASGRFARGHRPLARMTARILRAVEQSYVIPPDLAARGVTLRQYRVLSALQGGATNKQIARELGISEATVKYHLSALYRGLEFANRKQLIDSLPENEVFTESWPLS
ncbi:helix-turn-helix transcriptional regulator [Histidinibacterium lentulum]|uniref:LuxR family transcriptional regulator n=1 Tax=Histidinibacterium lentulum TaxID=2480588 RepID=A0A3N2R9U1_9RHOB|nr:LuxR family transcriptional regulator [Histidinibacterium lentulum]ROU04171.1 LuxR family transcriptional regulator [Histidinibacterium lentulum]